MTTVRVWGCCVFFLFSYSKYAGQNGAVLNTTTSPTTPSDLQSDRVAVGRVPAQYSNLSMAWVHSVLRTPYWRSELALHEAARLCSPTSSKLQRSDSNPLGCRFDASRISTRPSRGQRLQPGPRAAVSPPRRSQGPHRIRTGLQWVDSVCKPTRPGPKRVAPCTRNEASRRPKRTR